MNSVISDLDSLTPNDIAGAEFLYGYHITSTWMPPTVIRGDAFIYQITADNNPTSFDATNLAPGLSLNRLTGRIAGHPTTAGMYHMTVTAHSVLGDVTANVTIDVRPPSITSADSAYLEVGDDVTFQVIAEGHPSTFGAVDLPPGLRIDPHTGLITGTLTVSGAYFSGLTAISPTAGAANHSLFFQVSPPPPEMLKRFELNVNHLLVDPVRDRIYATVNFDPSIVVINTNNLSLVNTIPLTHEPVECVRRLMEGNFLSHPPLQQSKLSIFIH